MRFLLALHNAYTDQTSGAARSLRTIMEWLAAGGHECEVLGTARFDGGEPEEGFEEHLARLGVPLTRLPPSKTFTRSVQKSKNVLVGRPTVSYRLAGVQVTSLLTRHHHVLEPDEIESEQLLFLLDQTLKRFEPDVLLTCGGMPVIKQILRRARRRGVVTVFSLRNYGYLGRDWYEHVDHVLTNGPYLSAHFQEKIGLVSTGIESPIEWSEVLAPEEDRTCVTIVNPNLQKGGALFTRLADRLGSTRPDIPIMAILSSQGATCIREFLGIDLARYPQILGAPLVPRAADYFALTKILLVPSVFAEPFGRVAVEAMINGIPPLVSNRGALPMTVADGGRVLPIPEWMTESGMDLPSAAEVAPWYDAVCELWDHADRYAEASARARATAERLYSDRVLKERYLDYFSSLKTHGRVLA